MKNNDISEILQAIGHLGDVKGSAKFNYSISKAKNNLESELKNIEETVKIIQDEYTDDEKEILNKLQKREITEDEIDEENYNSILDKNKRINDFINSDYEGNEIYKIKLSYVPDDLTVKIFDKLMMIIDEENNIE